RPLVMEEERQRELEAPGDVGLRLAARLRDRQRGRGRFTESRRARVVRQEHVAEPVPTDEVMVDSAVFVEDETTLELYIVETKVLVTGMAMVAERRGGRETMPVLFEEEEIGGEGPEPIILRHVIHRALHRDAHGGVLGELRTLSCDAFEQGQREHGLPHRIQRIGTRI